MDCACDARELFYFGCQCGAFSFESSNHIWFNGIIYTIARTEEEACLLSKNYLLEFDDFNSAWLDGDGWTVMADDEPFTMLVQNDNEETRLAKEWIDYYGPGFLAAIY